MNKAELTKFSKSIAKDVAAHYGPVFYLYTANTDNLQGPLVTNSFLPGMLQKTFEFMNISQELITKLCKIKDNQDFITCKKVVILIRSSASANVTDTSVLVLDKR